MSEAQVYVVDASVVARWHLSSEPHTAFALAVRRDYEGGRIGLVAPDHFRYEVVSAFRKAVLTRRIDVVAGRVLVDDFLSWAFRLSKLGR
ncbi:MAG: type II toxin-antitoxin system VapC family toxin [Chloroflexota bacterium]